MITTDFKFRTLKEIFFELEKFLLYKGEEVVSLNEICENFKITSNMVVLQNDVLNLKINEVLYLLSQERNYYFKKTNGLCFICKIPFEIKNEQRVEEEVELKQKVSNDIDTIILECIKEFNGQFGTSGIVKILSASNGLKDSTYANNAKKSNFYGLLAGNKKKDIENAINNLVEKNIVLRTKGFRPVLRFSEQNFEEIKIKPASITETYDLNVCKKAKINTLREFNEEILQRNWGFNNFHDNQWAVIENLLNYKKVLLIEKTGFGKSLCYQYPAKIFYNLQGATTLVFSPLLALMRDQINHLNKINIPAAAINSNNSYEENMEIMKKATRNELAVLFIAPERLENDLWSKYISKIKLSMVVIDEAHCISVWGHDFRPNYRRILNVIKSLPKEFPILAVTATATNKVAEDIRAQIGDNIKLIKGSLKRENIALGVINCQNKAQKLLWLLKILNETDGNGLIYCGTRNETKFYSDWLKQNKINAVNYHAGMNNNDKKQIEEDFYQNKYKVITSTNALGMGIDKPDIRFVVHTQIPESPINYYQEIGRAGRDGKEAKAILLYSEKDSELCEFFIENSKPKFFKYKHAAMTLKQETLNLTDLSKKIELGEDKTYILLNDLIDLDIVKKEGQNYIYQKDSQKLNEDYLIWQKQQKLQELEKLIEYTKTNKCRMHYLCEYLEDTDSFECSNCDSCKDEKPVLGVFENKITEALNYEKQYSK